jgi:aspartate racemase
MGLVNAHNDRSNVRMKTLGLIGGLTWHSTIDYYRIINQTINDRAGGLQAARLILYSVNFGEFVPSPDEVWWRDTAARLAAIARKLEEAGAEGLLLCANTPHKVAGDIGAAVTIPLIHIVEVTAREIQAKKFRTVGLLGTRFTMEETFFTEKLSAAGIAAIIPEKDDRDFINSTIFGELGKGVLTTATKERYLRIIDALAKRGAEGVILGCTEIPLIVKPEDVPIPVFNTTLIHATAAVNFALGE